MASTAIFLLNILILAINTTLIYNHLIEFLEGVLTNFWDIALKSLSLPYDTLFQFTAEGVGLLRAPSELGDYRVSL